MKKDFTVLVLNSFVFFGAVIATTAAAEPEFKSELFKKGKLVYSDTFDGKYSSERWGMPKGKTVKDGELTILALHKTKEEAMKKLGRDHHLGLEPVGHMKGLPETFVCHMRFKYESDSITPHRPMWQIGHHMITINYLEGGGHKVRLPNKGPVFDEKASAMAINEWVDVEIEYKPGKLRLSINGKSKVYEHEKVSMHNPKDKHGPRFTFKHGIQGDNSRIVFDHVYLWEAE